MKDSAFLEDAKKVKVDIDSMSGAAISDFLRDVYQSTAAIVAKAAEYLGRNGK